MAVERRAAAGPGGVFGITQTTFAERRVARDPLRQAVRAEGELGAGRAARAGRGSRARATLPLIRIESPRSRRPSASASSGSSSGRSGFGTNCGSLPSGTRSARFVSPSSANASSRMLERPAGEALAARDREVPGEVELLAPDARAPERAEDAARSARGGPRPPGCGLRSRSARNAGWAWRRRPLRVAQVAQRDDVALALVEVHRRPDDQRHVARVGRVRVELGPDQLALERARVDDHDRLARVERALDVGDRHRAGARGRPRACRGPGTFVTIMLPGLKPSLAVVGRGADRLAEPVARHPVVAEREPLAGRAGGVGAREVVVRPRIEARRRVERIAGERARRQHGTRQTAAMSTPAPRAKCQRDERAG